MTEITRTATVSANVRAEVARRRVTQQALAAALGMSQQALSRRLTGLVAFNVDELDHVAAHLGVPVSALYGGDAPAAAASP